MFTTGRIIFTICFILVFAIALFLSYKKDKSKTQFHYKKNYLILLGIFGVLSFLFLIVKIRHFF